MRIEDIKPGMLVEARVDRADVRARVDKIGDKIIEGIYTIRVIPEKEEHYLPPAMMNGFDIGSNNLHKCHTHTIYVYYDRIGHVQHQIGKEQSAEVNGARNGWTWCIVNDQQPTYNRANLWFDNAEKATVNARRWNEHYHPDDLTVVQGFPPADIITRMYEATITASITEDHVVAWLENRAKAAYARNEALFSAAGWPHVTDPTHWYGDAKHGIVGIDEKAAKKAKHLRKAIAVIRGE